MTERDLYADIGLYARRVMKQTCAIEVKLCKEKSLPFSAIPDHQIQSLLLARDRVFSWKIADEGIAQKPFDMVVLAGVPSYLALVWYEKRTKKNCYFIDIARYVSFKYIQTSKEKPQKSITETDAVSLCEFMIEL